MADLESQRRVKELRLAYLKSKVEQEERLFKIGASSKDVLEQAKLDEHIAATEKSGLEETIANTKQTLSNQLEGVKAEIAALKNERADVQRRLDILTCRALRSGVLTMVVQQVGATIHRGDIIARVADLSRYRVDAEVSDIHSREIGVGMPARVMANGLSSTGRVSSINPSIENGIMKFTVALDDANEPALRSNLRVDVAVVTEKRGTALRVARGPFITGAATEEVFVVHGDRAERKSVKIGVSGYDYVEIVDGLKKGDEIIVSDMRDYIHVRELKLK